MVEERLQLLPEERCIFRWNWSCQEQGFQRGKASQGAPVRGTVRRPGGESDSRGHDLGEHRGGGLVGLCHGELDSAGLRRCISQKTQFCRRDTRKGVFDFSHSFSNRMCM